MQKLINFVLEAKKAGDQLVAEAQNQGNELVKNAKNR